MRKAFIVYFSALLILFSTTIAQAAIDMQFHVASDAGKNAYTTYETKQASYYTGNYTYEKIVAQNGANLFGVLNELMGSTNKILGSSYNYGALRYEYKNVDKDLNKSGYIIGYYDGRSMDGEWGSGWNREHTWPQSKFKGSYSSGTSIPIGYDMQSVRPSSESVNSDRGNTAYGESGSYYDPNEIAINNPNYQTSSNGTYRGDCARVILYDYINYGKNGAFSNKLYDSACKTDLLTQIGSNSNSVFESLTVLLKWHMQDPPSLTEMVRNDGGQTYQGNRNPFIDYPELAINMLKDEQNVTVCGVTTNTTAKINPHYTYTTNGGFVTYLTFTNGTHPISVDVTGATSNYEASLGRLTVTKVTGAVTITTNTSNAVETLVIDQISYYGRDGIVYVSRLKANSSVTIFDCAGRIIEQRNNCQPEEQFNLPQGLYVLHVNNGITQNFKIVY